MERGEKLFHLFEKLGKQYAIHGTCFLSGDRRNEELKKLFELSLERGKIDGAIWIAKLLEEPDRTEAIMKLFSEDLWLSDTLDLAVLLPTHQRITKLEEMLERYHMSGRLCAAESIAKILTEPQRTNELAKIVEIYIKKGQLNEARGIANIILENNKK